MKYNYLKSALLVGALAGSFVAKTNAQIDKCGSHIHQVELQYPGTQQKADAFLDDFQTWINNADLSQFETSESGKKIVPVVFHLYHRGFAGANSPLSKTRAVALSHLAVLNKNFAGQNPNLPMLHTAFDTLISNTGLEFRLANLDPQGNPTDGMEYLFTGKTVNVRDDINFKQLSVWDRRKYYNIWVVESIESSTPGQTTLGYAQFPFQNGSTLNLGSTDGITIITNELKANSAGTTTHETGHWLGLRHIWGDDECGSDGIEDTPQHKAPNYSSSACFPIPKEATCVSMIGLTGQDSVDAYIKKYDVGEMWMNFMDYSDDNCLWMFTKGQNNMFDYVFTNYTFRGSVVSAENSIITGTDDATFANPPLRAPISDFYANRAPNDRLLSVRMACVDNPIQFRGGEFNALATTHSWNLEGATPSSASTKDISASYANPGSYTGSYTVKNDVGESTKTREDYIKIFPKTGEVDVTWGFVDPFEYNSHFEQGLWLLVNDNAEQNPVNKWSHFEGAGYKSSKSIRLNNINNVRTEKDAIISPSFNLSSYSSSGNLTLSFRYASAKRTSQVTQKDKIEVFYSTDCGETWTPTATNTINDNDLATAGLQAGVFIPKTPTEWGLKTIDINSIKSQTNVKFMILFTSDGPFGNDVYIDDFGISSSGTVGVVDHSIASFNVFPNPVTEESTIIFDLDETKELSISVLDITGRVLHQVYTGSLTSGTHSMSLNSNLFTSSGVYFVRMIANNEIITKKIVVVK